MREIKFRGKRLDNGEWEYGDLLQYDDGSVCIGVHSKNYTDDGFNVGQYHHIAPVNEDTVGEYTGLKDRKGIAIYEGDVIRSPLSEDKTRPHRIFYHTGNAAFMGALIDRKELCYLRLDQDWIYKFGKEVIGNIHDNPELIEKQTAERHKNKNSMFKKLDYQVFPSEEKPSVLSMTRYMAGRIAMRFNTRRAFLTEKQSMCPSKPAFSLYRKMTTEVSLMACSRSS